MRVVFSLFSLLFWLRQYFVNHSSDFLWKENWWETYRTLCWIAKSTLLYHFAVIYMWLQCGLFFTEMCHLYVYSCELIGIYFCVVLLNMFLSKWAYTLDEVCKAFPCLGTSRYFTGFPYIWVGDFDGSRHMQSWSVNNSSGHAALKLGERRKKWALNLQSEQHCKHTCYHYMQSKGAHVSTHIQPSHGEKERKWALLSKLNYTVNMCATSKKIKS